MREARPLDLNYGHLGEPIYDSEYKKWHFGRVPQVTQQLRPVGKPTVAHQSSLAFENAHYQSAAERLKNLKDLTQQCPELLPGSHMLPALAQTSETIDELTSAHDPTVSDLLACGRAIDRGLSHHSNTLPIIAIAGGKAGELVRLISLTQEHLGWSESKNVYLKNFSSRKGEEAQWSGNGSPIQQLVFAESEGRSTSWLAVRYHGAISILRPQLRRNHDTWNLNQTGAPNSRLDPGHILTLSARRSQRTQFADVTFNPWDQQQIATIDQEGRWTVWNIKRLISQQGLWKIEEVCVGSILEGPATDVEKHTSLEDGWGAVLWAGVSNRLVVTGRKAFAVFDLKDGSSRISTPDLVSKEKPHHILDIRRCHSATSNVYILTSLSLHLIRIPTFEDASGSGVQVLLSWRHFRDLGDVSLRLNLLTPSEDTSSKPIASAETVLLYSRVTGIATTYKFQCSTSFSAHAISTSDPSLLTIPEAEVGTAATSICDPNRLSRRRVSALALITVPYGFYNTGPPSGLGQLYVEKNATFYQLRIFFNDLSVSECLYSESEATPDLEIQPPNTRIRKERVKTTEKVLNEFIVQDGVEGQESEDFPIETNQSPPVNPASSAESQLAGADPMTINFERLNENLNNVDRCHGEAFNLILKHLHETIEAMKAEKSPHLKTLHDVVDTKISVSDIDKASVDFKKFLVDIGQLNISDDDHLDSGENKKVSINSTPTPLMQDVLNLEDDAGMFTVHDSLVQIWITSLSYGIPSRIRMALERRLRNTAARIILSNYAVSFGPKLADDQQAGDTPASSLGAQFSLPVRRRSSMSNLSKGKKAAARSSSPFLSSQVSEDAGFLPPPTRGALPTPEPTPSLHSRSSISSLTASEDASSIYLRAFTSIKPQPALSMNHSNCLGHWGTVANPDDYNWEATQQLFASDDEDQAEERVKQWERAQKRQKRRRGTTDGSSSQPQPRKFGGSQPPQLHDDPQGSSQATPALGTASQVEPGRFGGRYGPKKKKKVMAPRAAGFK